MLVLIVYVSQRKTKQEKQMFSNIQEALNKYISQLSVAPISNSAGLIEELIITLENNIDSFRCSHQNCNMVVSSRIDINFDLEKLYFKSALYKMEHKLHTDSVKDFNMSLVFAQQNYNTVEYTKHKRRLAKLLLKIQLADEELRSKCINLAKVKRHIKSIKKLRYLLKEEESNIFGRNESIYEGLKYMDIPIIIARFERTIETLSRFSH